MATIKGITIDIGGNTTGLDRALQGVNTKSRNLQSELKQVENLLKFDPSNTELLAQKQQLLSESVEETKKKLETLKEAEAQVQQQVQEGKVNEEQYRAFQREITKTEQSLNKYEDELKKTEVQAKNAANATEEVGKVAEQNEPGMKKMSAVAVVELTAVAEASAEVTSKMLEIGKAAFEVGNNFDASGKRLQAQLGITEEAAESLNDSVKGIYIDNFGESISGVSNDVAILKQNIKELTDSQIQDMSKGIYTIVDLFDGDFQEVTKAAATLMREFGVDGMTALDLITYGFQNGANKSGDFLDTLNEYSVQYKQLGYDSEQFIETLVVGSDKGAFSIDKVGDSLKEFNIRLKDGSDSTRQALTQLGFDADAMMGNFAQGGDIARQSFDQVVKALKSTNDPLQQNIMGVSLFGTQWEDVGADVILSMDNIKGNLDGMTGSTVKNMNTISDTVGSRSEKAFRKLEMSSTKAFDAMAPGIEIVSEGISFFAEALDETPKPLAAFGTGAAIFGVVAIPAVIGINAMKTAIAGLGATINTALPILGLIGVAIGAVTALVSVYTERQEELAEASEKYYQEGLSNRLAGLKEEQAATQASIDHTNTYANKLAELQGINVSTNVEVETNGAYAELEDVKQILFDISMGGEDAAEAMGLLAESVDNWVEAQKRAQDAKFAQELDELARAYKDGQLSVEEYTAAYEDIFNRQDSYNKSMDETGQILKDIKSGNMSASEAALAYADSITKADAAIGKSTETVQTSSDSIKDLQQSYANGYGAEALTLKVEKLNEVIGTEQEAAVQSAASMFATYNDALMANNQIIDASAEYGQQFISQAREKEDAYDAIAQAAYGMGDAEQTAAGLAQIYRKEDLDALRIDMQERLGTQELTYANILGLAEVYCSDRETQEKNLQLDLEALEAEKNNNLKDEDRQAALDRNGIFAEYVAGREDAERQLATNLSTITSGWTQADYTQFAQWAADKNIAIDQEALNSQAGFMNMVQGWSDTLATGTDEGKENVIRKMNEILPGLQGVNSQVSAEMTKTTDIVSSGAQNAASTVNSSVGDTGKGLSKVAGDTSAAASKIDTSTKNVANSSQTMQSNVSTATQGVSTDVGRMADDVQTAEKEWKDATESIRADAEDKLSKVKKSIDDISKSIDDVNAKTIKINVDRDIVLPHFEMEGAFNPKTGGVPSINVKWFEKGGIFNMPAIIGVGEAGAEAVIPLDKLGGIVQDAMKKMRTGSGDTYVMQVYPKDLSEQQQSQLFNKFDRWIGGSTSRRYI